MVYALNFVAGILMGFCGTSWSEPPDQVANPFASPAENERGPRPKAMNDVPLTADALALAKQKIEKLGGAVPPQGWDDFVLEILETCRPPNTYSDGAIQITSLPPPDDLLTMPSEFVAEVLKRTMDEPLKSSAESWKKSHPGETPPAALASEVRSRARKSLVNARDNVLPLDGLKALLLMGTAGGTGMPVLYCLACLASREMPSLRTALEVTAMGVGIGNGFGLAMGTSLALVAKGVNPKFHLLDAKAWRLLSHPSPPSVDCDFTGLKSKP